MLFVYQTMPDRLHPLFTAFTDAVLRTVFRILQDVRNVIKWQKVTIKIKQL